MPSWSISSYILAISPHTNNHLYGACPNLHWASRFQSWNLSFTWELFHIPKCSESGIDITRRPKAFPARRYFCLRGCLTYGKIGLHLHHLPFFAITSCQSATTSLSFGRKYGVGISPPCRSGPKSSKALPSILIFAIASRTFKLHGV